MVHRVGHVTLNPELQQHLSSIATRWDLAEHWVCLQRVPIDRKASAPRACLEREVVLLLLNRELQSKDI